MSGVALNWVGVVVLPKYPQLKANSRLVLFALANRHNQSTGRCDPSKVTLADDTGLSEASIKRSIRELNKLKVIHTTRRNRKGNWKNLTNLVAFRDVRGGVTQTHKVGSHRPPNNGIDTSKVQRPTTPYDVVINEQAEDECLIEEARVFGAGSSQFIEKIKKEITA